MVPDLTYAQIHYKRGTIMSKRSLSISILIVSIAALSIGASLGFINQSNAADVSAIQNVITKGVDTFGNVHVLPAPQVSSLEKIPDNVKQKMSDKYSTELSKYYNGPLLTERINQCKGGLEFQEGNKFRVKDGGVKKVENFKVTIDGDKATAEADITRWVKMYDQRGDNQSQDTAHFTFNLNKIDGQWKITAEDWTYLPGNNP